MQLTRDQKEQMVVELAEKMDESPVIGVLDMHSLPAKQLQEIKKELVGAADIKMTRKTLINLALEQSDRENIKALEDNDATMPALIFSDDNPFSLFKLIQEKKTSAPASGGEVAPDDVVLQEGGTGLEPGPMLGQIQELGAPTGVEDGEIAIQQQTTVVEAGEVIDRKTAEVLNTLEIEPLEVGLDLKLVYENGDVFGRDVLAIDTDEYRTQVESGTAAAFNLAVNAGFITTETVLPLIQQNATRAHNLAVNAGVVNDDTIEALLSKAAGHARGLDASIDLEAAADASSEDADDSAADETAESEDDEPDAEEEGDDAEADESAEDDPEKDEE